MRQLQLLSIAAIGLLIASSGTAGIHTWDVSEVFTNHDGTIQYVELFDSGLGGNETGVGNGTISSLTQSHTWANGPVTPPTNGKFYLVATAGFAALPGAPTPDVIIPAEKVPFFSAVTLSRFAPTHPTAFAFGASNVPSDIC